MNESKQFFSKIGFNYLILGVLAIIFQIIIVNIISVTNPIYLNDINILTIISSICNYLLPFPVFYWLMKKLNDERIEKHNLGAKKFITYAAVTITLMWIGNLIGLFITTFLSGAMQNEIANPVQQLISSTNIWINIIILTIIAPIFEEILFRKFLIDRTIKYGVNVSVLASATLFALFHGNLNQFFYAFLMGGFFSYVYAKTGKITYTIILHAIVNFMGSVVSLFVAQAVLNLQTGTSTLDIILVVSYILIMLISLVITIFKLFKFRPGKPELPLKTVFLNYGIVCFMGFFIIEIIRQLLG